ncbi:MAG: TonB-dependent receptor [Deltaproteobacteria bacterium]|jgi:iron complex outermembrane recepter protein|nr:TonB-dependent receptor [Deltaproteobacteria bacterium]MBT6490275.1 TonB-dependent receptor [Deltaproteobacteria bacterium]
MMTGVVFVSYLGMLASTECHGIASGRITDSKNNKPVSDTRIEASDGTLIAQSKEDGSFKLEGLCSGGIKIRFLRWGYASQEIRLQNERNPEQPISVLLDPVTEQAPDEITVRAKTPKESSQMRAVVSLDGDDLLRTRGKNLADTLAELPGVTVLRSGNAAKPIVRGQHGSRLLMLFDGVRHEGQDWGLNHGAEIDPFAAGSIRVVKGSAGVRYGPDAIAGVLLVDPPPMLTEPGIRLETQTIGALNGRRGTVAARIDGNPEQLTNLSWRLDGNYSRGAGLDTPAHPLDNTGIEEWNAGGAVAYEGECWSLKLSFHHKTDTSGVCRCVRKETTADFDAQVLLDEPVYSELYEADYEIERPYQGVTHDIAIARGKLEIGDLGELELTYSFQRNDRKEYEIVRVETDYAQHNFTLRTHTADALFRHAVEISADTRLEGLIGVSGILQENVYRGWPLLSDYRGLGGGIFAVERFIFDDFEIEAGVRFDHTTRHAYLPKKTFQSLVREERIDSETCNIGEDFSRCDSSFNAVTFSLGGMVDIASGVRAKIDLSSATRAPTINEQYLNGTSPSFPVMARGNHTLKAETSWSASATLKADWSIFQSEVSIYGSLIDDYIYLSPELRDDGTIRTDVLIQGRFPRFSYDPINAVFYGVDADALVQLGSFDLALQGSLVHARNTQNNEFLIFIPPDQLRAEITYLLPDFEWIEDSQVSVNATLVASQHNVSPDSDFAPVPDGYALFGARASTVFYIGEGRYLFSVEMQNILNHRYRDYTSLLRYFSDEPGRQMFVRLGTEFGFYQ